MIINRNIAALVLSFGFLVFLVSSAAAQSDVSPRSSVQKDRIDGYIAALNKGDDASLTSFISQNFTAESLKAVPVESRLPFLKQVHGDMQMGVLKRIENISDHEINAFVQGASGNWFRLSFVFEPEPPFKLSVVRIQMVNGPDADKPEPANQPRISRTEAINQIGALIDDLLRADEFSGVVVVAQGDKPFFAKAYGLANLDAKTPNKVETKFNIGSIDKIFTKIAIGQLVAQGKLSYDDTLGKFLPDYPNKDAAAKITIRELLDHRSGVGDIFGDAYRSTPKEKLRSIDDFIPLFSNKPLAFEPGTKEQYSNGGYVLLGAIIEKVSGESYYDYVDKHIFMPLGMKNTAFYDAFKPTPNMAEGYTKMGVDAGAPNKRQNNLFTRPARGSSAGGGYSTAEDLLRFSMAYQTRKISIPQDPSPDPATGTMAPGIGIAGGSPGVNASLEILAGQGYTVIVLSNYDPPSAEKPSRQIVSILERTTDR
jgi:D-alanyl-D-alanine carboxypeptidase